MVELQKAAGYLLDLRHPDGRSKARFFLAFGFSPSEPQLLMDALAALAQQDLLLPPMPDEHGMVYVIAGAIKTPDGRDCNVKSVWIVQGELPPRLVTAYPHHR